MKDPSIFIRLIGDSDHYDPGDTLSGEFFIDTDDPESIRAVEISVLWYTEGKGEEDLDVHFFKRIGNDNGDFVDMRQSQAFSTALPDGFHAVRRSQLMRNVKNKIWIDNRKHARRSSEVAAMRGHAQRPRAPRDR